MDALWYKDAVIYELLVRSFFDANGDGYGDFEGLRHKLPYLERLGVDTLWLLPFYESPLRDDGYDISDYYKILPVHGTLDDFKEFLDEAHRKGMRVITELVLNHTSDQHPWFQESRQPGSARRNWYVWSDTPERYRDARVIFQDFEHANWTWDPVAHAYYWHRFFSHQPDLNWDNPEVEEALKQALFFWADQGVDGFRLDAIPYLYEREGTSCENLPETIAVVKRLRKALEERYGPTKILLAEANQWPEDTLPYFGNGDGVHMAYNFPLMPRMFLSLRREDRGPIEQMLELTSGIPETAQWALFLRNHDELTLEMLVDEERDYLYHEYATDPQYRINLGIRRRLAPLLGGERRRIELMNALLFSLPGTPVLYYGDEICMGDNPFLGDRNGVRTPMQWSADRNAGFSSAPFHKLFLPPVQEGPYSFNFVNVEAEEANPHSSLTFTQRLLGIRNQYRKVFGRGKLTWLSVENRAVLAFIRTYEEESVLIVANLSRYAQYADLPLDDWQGLVPYELFSQGPFPDINQDPYPITLGPHGFYWFVLRDPAYYPPPVSEEPELELAPAPRALPWLRFYGGLETILVETMAKGDARVALEAELPDFLKAQRWFLNTGQEIDRVRLADAVRLTTQPLPIYISTVYTDYADQTQERYLLPLALSTGREQTRTLLSDYPNCGVAFVRANGERGLLFDATVLPAFWQVLYERLLARWKGRGLKSKYRFSPAGSELPASGAARIADGGRYNSAAVLGEQVFLKLYRRLEPGPNPRVELQSALRQRDFPFVPKLYGTFVVQQGEQPVHLGMAQAYLEDLQRETDLLHEEIRRVIERARGVLPSGDEQATALWLEHHAAELTTTALQIGTRTGELHRTLAQAEGPGIDPMPTLTENLAQVAARARGALNKMRAHLSTKQIVAAAQMIEDLPMEGGWMMIRIHGNYDPTQLVRSSGELYVLGFEGEPGHPLSERRAPGQALSDMERMAHGLCCTLRKSIKQYAEFNESSSATHIGEQLIEAMEGAYREAYLATAGQDASFLPAETSARDRLSRVFRLIYILESLTPPADESTESCYAEKDLLRLLGS